MAIPKPATQVSPYDLGGVRERELLAQACACYQDVVEKDVNSYNHISGGLDEVLPAFFANSRDFIPLRRVDGTVFAQAPDYFIGFDYDGAKIIWQLVSINSYFWFDASLSEIECADQDQDFTDFFNPAQPLWNG